jgi:hypothetical protein
LNRRSLGNADSKLKSAGVAPLAVSKSQAV